MVDVAREAGVALRTVSRVVNGDPTVGEEFAERVRRAIAALDYQPDERARQLRSSSTGTIGAAVRNISDYHPVLGAAYEAARYAGLTMVAMSTEDDEEREREAVMSMCRRRMDGIIIEPIADSHQYLQPEIDSGLTVVAFDRPATGVIADTVLTDNRGGIEQAFGHLARQGHRRIGYIGDSLVHPGPITPERISASLATLMDGPDPATAIVTGNASTTIAVIRLLSADFGTTSLVGFDDFPLADLLRPGLTVVAQGEAQMGAAVIDLFCARRMDPERPIQTVTVPTTLIPRGSGEIPVPR
jgi:LacI family transcriptional regulator